MYVAVKGGEAAILNSYQLLARQRRGDTAQPELSVAQIRQQLKLAVDRVMTEGSVYDLELAALAIKQAAGDLVEAIFLLRAYRATLPRLGTTCPLDTSRMALDRRISATFKDLPGVVPSDATEEYSNKDAPRCTQQVEVPSSDRTHWMPRSVYVCEKSGMTWSSTQPPPSSIRTLRGLDR